MIAVSYFAYLVVSISLTVWVGRVLHRSGRFFLLDAIRGNAPLADSVNQLLIVGFYLINTGYIVLALKTEGEVNSVRQAIEIESAKIGIVLLILGGMHFCNIFILARMRNRAQQEERFA